ncbi:MAG: hypothetical protein KatS3mg061_1387 [Dehalococcoidia bacterium]|nr:MAG: hypothetical protein KatS3mg061_1387 [Dehalococcoidia bacterium]
MGVKLSEFFPRLRDLGTVRLVASNGTAVLEFTTQIDEVTLGPRSWNFTRGGQEFHLYRDKVKAVSLFYGEHPRFKRVSRRDRLPGRARQRWDDAFPRRAGRRPHEPSGPGAAAAHCRLR